MRPPAWIAPPWRSPRRRGLPILPRLGAPVRYLGTKMPQHLPRSPKKHPLGANIFQHSSQNPPKTASRSFQRKPQHPKNHQKWWSVGRFYTSAIFSKIAKKVTQNAPRTPPKALKLSPRWPSWRHHGPSWAQLAANLAHLSSILSPSSPQLRQKSAPNRQEAPPDTPRPPRGSPEGSRKAAGA